MQKPVLVIKLGSAVISDENGFIETTLIKKLAAEIALLSRKYYPVLVSSGAVGSGKAFIENYRGSLTERKAAAAVGNPILIRLYDKCFSKHKIKVAQALCERHHFSNRVQFLQLRDTFHEFWKHNILPVVNENDLVSNVELKFSDNDELATLIAIGFNAETLVLCTSSGGLVDDKKNIISTIEKIDDSIMGFVNPGKSLLGLGGMLSKLTFARLATSFGIKVIICGLDGKDPITKAMMEKSGSTFMPKRSNLKARQKWLASGSITFGSIEVDAGAAKALMSRKSLLSIGIKRTTGMFEPGEVVQLVSDVGNIIGVAKTRIGASELNKKLKEKSTIAAHADDIVLF